MKEQELTLSPGVYSLMKGKKDIVPTVMNAISRFLKGDWGYVTERQRIKNDRMARSRNSLLPCRLFSALSCGRIIFAVYDFIDMKGKGFIWIVEETGNISNNSRIYVMCPEEYGSWYKSPTYKDKKKEA